MKPASVIVIAGPHKGRYGNIVSIPWLGNLWNLRPTLNVAGYDGNREWIKVWRWQVRGV